MRVIEISEFGGPDVLRIAQRATPSVEIRPGMGAITESSETTHLSAVDKDGNAVANTYTLNFGYGVGLDLTRRDLQAEAKKLARPWDMAKAFDRSALTAAPLRGLAILTCMDARIDVEDALGLRVGDLIVQINRTPIAGAEDAARALRGLSGRGPARLFFERGGRYHSTSFYVR